MESNLGKRKEKIICSVINRLTKSVDESKAMEREMSQKDLVIIEIKISIKKIRKDETVKD